MRRTHRKDNTQDEIVKALRDAGYEVHIIGGAIDALVCSPIRKRVWPMDFKSENTPTTDKQRKLVDAGWPILFPKTSQEALDMVKPC